MTDEPFRQKTQLGRGFDPVLVEQRVGTISGRQIDMDAKAALKELLDPDQFDEREAAGSIVVDQKIEIALRTRVITRGQSKQVEPSRASAFNAPACCFRDAIASRLLIVAPVTSRTVRLKPDGHFDRAQRPPAPRQDPWDRKTPFGIRPNPPANNSLARHPRAAISASTRQEMCRLYIFDLARIRIRDAQLQAPQIPVLICREHIGVLEDKDGARAPQAPIPKIWQLLLAQSEQPSSPSRLRFDRLGKMANLKVRSPDQASPPIQSDLKGNVWQPRPNQRARIRRVGSER